MLKNDLKNIVFLILYHSYCRHVPPLTSMDAVFLKLVWNKTKTCNYAVSTGSLAVNFTVNVERKVQLSQFI
jgi:hypothetical protein